MTTRTMRPYRTTTLSPRCKDFGTINSSFVSLPPKYWLKLDGARSENRANSTKNVVVWLNFRRRLLADFPE